MLTRTHLNLLLLVILAILVSLTLFEPGVEKEPVKTTISQQQKQSVQRIKIQRSNHPTIELAKEGDQWWMTAPKKLMAKSSLVERILALQNDTSHSRYPLSTFDLATIGLDEPRLCLWLDDQKYCFGNREPLHQLRYLQVGDEVHLINDTLSHFLSYRFSDYVSPKLFPNDSFISAINLGHQQLQSVDGIWQLTPDDPDISADERQRLIDAWQQARALTVTPYQDDDLEELITIQLGDQNIKFEILSSEPELVLGRRDLGIQYHFSEGSLAQLTRLENEEQIP
jgi:hypothetical protein